MVIFTFCGCECTDDDDAVSFGAVVAVDDSSISSVLDEIDGGGASCDDGISLYLCALNVTVSLSDSLNSMCSVCSGALLLLEGSGLVSAIRAPVAILLP